MKTILTIVVLIIAYAITRLVIWFVFGFVRVTLKRRKIAKLDRLDRMDNGNTLRTYFLEMDATKQRILDRWPGQFPPGEEGKLVQQLASDSLVCIAQNPRVMSKGGVNDVQARQG